MQLFNCKIVRKNLTLKDEVAFTFDDGPHPKNSIQIMNVLESAKGKGTFFVTGSNITGNRAVAKEMVDRGHLLGNHTFQHGKALFQRKATLYDEIVRTKALIEDITGKQNRFFRPPHGIITPALLFVCRKLELTIVLWNANSMDFRRESYEKIAKRIDHKVKRGAIVLFHEGHFKDTALDYSNSIEALKCVIKTAVSKNLKLVTLEEMIEQE